MEIIKNEFEIMTNDQLDLSVKLYGKKVMCFVAKDIPARDEIFKKGQFHTRDHIINLFENKIILEKCPIFFFPENFLTQEERRNFLLKALRQKNIKELIIVTADPIIITDFIHPVVRIMSRNSKRIITVQSAEVINKVFCKGERPEEVGKTFFANVHDIYTQTLGLKSMIGAKATKLVLPWIDISNQVKPLEKYLEIRKLCDLMGDRIVSTLTKRQLDAKIEKLQKK